MPNADDTTWKRYADLTPDEQRQATAGWPWSDQDTLNAWEYLHVYGSQWARRGIGVKGE